MKWIARLEYFTSNFIAIFSIFLLIVIIGSLIFLLGQVLLDIFWQGDPLDKEIHTGKIDINNPYQFFPISKNGDKTSKQKK